VTRAFYPGSFDPLTLGHVDIASRAARLFDSLVVAVDARPTRNPLFSVEERVALARESLRDHPDITVTSYEGLVVEAAGAAGATVVIRGLRVISDFDAEYQRALMGRELAPGIEFVCLMASAEFTFLNSAIVREVVLLGGDVQQFVPAPVRAALARRT
jgi:pantetheine-phosphate adenylyltransferase